MLKDKKEQPKDRELQEHKESHTSNGRLAFLSLFRAKGQLCVCFTPLRSANLAQLNRMQPVLILL